MYKYIVIKVQTIDLYKSDILLNLVIRKMNIRLLLLIVAAVLLKTISAINPYHVLELQQGATQDQIRNQYKILKQNAKENKIKLQLYQDAYQQIMIQSSLQMTLPKQQANKVPKQNRRNRRRRRGLPRLSDMFRMDYTAPKQNKPQKSSNQKAIEAQDQKNYAQQIQNQHGYRLPPEYDDPSYYKNQKKVQQTIKDENVTFNIKAARFILFIGGILLKLSPCICLYLIYKFRKQNPRDLREGQQENNPFVKAMNGWTGKNRRVIKKTK